MSAIVFLLRRKLREKEGRKKPDQEDFLNFIPDILRAGLWVRVKKKNVKSYRALIKATYKLHAFISNPA